LNAGPGLEALGQRCESRKTTNNPFGSAQVTSFVRIAGVLLAFNYLIVPAVCGINLVGGFTRRMLVGCIVSLLGGIGGLFASFWWDLPTDAAIVAVFGVLLLVVTAWTRVAAGRAGLA